MTRNRYRGFFWPAILILAGILALLANIGVLSADRLSKLGDLWPLVLIVIGLELIARRAFQGPAAEMAGALIVILAVGGAVAYVALGPNTVGGIHTLDTSEAVGKVNHASLEIDAGAATITVTGTDLGTDLYHAHIEYQGQKPDVNLDRSSGLLQISQNSSGFNFFDNRRFVLDLQINASVPWKITDNTGAAAGTYKLGTVQLTSMDLNTGASREDITLGTPVGDVAISINGGALTVHLHRPSGTAASVQVSGGAVSLDFDGRQHRAIGSVSGSTATSVDSFHVDVNGGACTVTMDATAANL